MERQVPNSTPSVCVLLAGGPRPSPLIAQTGRAALDLSLTPDLRVSELWMKRIREFGGTTVRIVHSANAPAPRIEGDDDLDVQVFCEPKDYRGAAGVTRDVCESDPDDALIFLAEAGRCVSTSLAPMIEAHRDTGAGVTVASNPDDSPAGIYLLRRGLLDLVPMNGYMDLKEQWLSKVIGSGVDVRVFRLESPGAFQLRSVEQFLLAAASMAGIEIGPDRRPRGFKVVSPRAAIGAGTVIVDSVVMPDAIIEDGAVVARSIVCPKGRVAANTNAVDMVVKAEVA